MCGLLPLELLTDGEYNLYVNLKSKAFLSQMEKADHPKVLDSGRDCFECLSDRHCSNVGK